MNDSHKAFRADLRKFIETLREVGLMRVGVGVRGLWLMGLGLLC